MSNYGSDITSLKHALRSLLLGVAGIGTIDTARIDTDDAPHKLRATVNPYWSLTLAGRADTEAGFGTTSRALYCDYTLRLEGWRGIQAANETTDAWESLCERIQDHLQRNQKHAAQLGEVTGVMVFEGLACTLDVAQFGSSRAHHAVFTARYRVFRRLS